jgi:hypothetical protein
MNTKTFGILMLVIGIFMISYFGFDIIEKQKVLKIGTLVVENETPITNYLSPALGAVILVFEIVLIINNKNTITK